MVAALTLAVLAGCASPSVGADDVNPDTIALRVPKTDPGPPVFDGPPAAATPPWAGLQGPVPLGPDDATFTARLRERFPPGSGFVALMTALERQGFVCGPAEAGGAAAGAVCAARVEEAGCTVSWGVRVTRAADVVVGLSGTRAAACPTG